MLNNKYKQTIVQQFACILDSVLILVVIVSFEYEPNVFALVTFHHLPSQLLLNVSNEKEALELGVH